MKEENVMKKILSLVLSFTLLFNALAPAFAGVPKGRRIPVKKYFSRPNVEALRKLACRKAANAKVQERLKTWRNSDRPLSSQSGAWVARSFATGNYQGLAEELLSMSTPEKSLMQNELVGLFLAGEVSPAQREQFLDYFQKSLVGAKEVFGAVSIPERYLITEQEAEAWRHSELLPGEEAIENPERSTEEVQELLNSRLEGVEEWIEQDPAINAALDLLADATALGLMGSEKNIPSLIEVYEASIGTPFEPMAGTLVLRSLVRFQLYDTLLTFFVNPNYPAGKYIDDFAKELSSGLQNLFHKPAHPDYREDGNASGFYLKLEPYTASFLEFRLGIALREKGPFVQALLWKGEILPQDWFAMGCEALVADWKTIKKEGVVFNNDAFSPTLPLKPLPQLKPEDTRKPEVNITRSAHLNYSSVAPVLESPSEDLTDSAEDYAPLVSSRVVPSVSVQGTGFKFTLERGTLEEDILPNVNISISEGIKAAKFSRVTINKDGTIELRGEGQKNTPMHQFYFQLSPEGGALDALIRGTKDFPRNTLYIKLISNKKNGVIQEVSRQWDKWARHQITVASIPLYDSTQEELVIALTDTSLLPQECIDRGITGILVVRDNQVFYEDEEGSYLLEDFYVRLPKEFRRIWAPIMLNNPQQPFYLTVLPTHDKTFIMKYIVPLLQVGTGKAFGPIMHGLGLSHVWANGIPMFANNGLPLFLSPLMPVLRKYGDVNIYRAGIGLYALSAIGALGLGLNGFMGVENAGPVQVAGLIAVLFGMGAANVLTRTNQNNLILQNQGKIIAPKAKKEKWKGDSSQDPTFRFLAKRFKEVFTKKPTEKRSMVLFQTASMFKNLGTFAFLASPYLFNLASQAMGSSLRADFSLSFWLLGGVSLYALYHALRLPLKDTFIRNPETLERLLEEKEYELLPAIKAELNKPGEEQDFSKIAKELHKIISPLAQAESFKTQGKEEDLCSGLEWRSILRLSDMLREEGVSSRQSAQIETALREQFDAFGRKNIRYKDILRTPGMASALMGMMLLTSHELGTSLGFAYAINQAIEKVGITGDENLAFGAFLSAFFLYGTAFLSRGLGNALSMRITEGTMYAFSSLCSAVGTGLMIGANGNFAPLLSGVVLAGFGMGNFFSQVFEYTRNLNPKYAPEIAQLITLTMPVAAALSSQFPTVAHMAGVPGLDLILCAGALAGGLWATRKMFEDSSIVRSARYYWQKLKDKIRRSNPSEEVTEGAPQDLPEGQDVLEDAPQNSSTQEETTPTIPSKYRVPVHG